METSLEDQGVLAGLNWKFILQLKLSLYFRIRLTWGTLLKTVGQNG